MISSKIKNALKNAISKVQDKRKREAIQKKEITKIEDIFVQSTRFKNVKLPIINAFAYDLLDKYFNPLENMDISKPEHLGVFVYIVENQQDPGLIDVAPEDVRLLGLHRLMDIPQKHIPDYIACVAQMLDEIKKKVYGQMEMILADLQKFQDGEASVSDLLKGWEKNQKNTT